MSGESTDAGDGPGPATPAESGPIVRASELPAIRRRVRANRTVGALLAAAFAILLTPIVLAEELVVYRTPIEPDVPSPYSFRIAQETASRLAFAPGRLLIARGERPSAAQA